MKSLTYLNPTFPVLEKDHSQLKCHKKKLKTMVVRVGEGKYLIVLVPGDNVIDWKKLRHAVGESRLSLAPQEEAERATGFKRGTITPFGLATPMPVVVDESMRGERISLGAGEPGVNLVLAADDLIGHVGAIVADISKLS